MRNLNGGGLRNLRDLGGLPTRRSSTGRTIAHHIARGPRRELLTADGWNAATQRGLRSVVDMRRADEVGARDSDPDVPPPADLAIALAPTEDQMHPEFRAVCLPILDWPEYWQHSIRILPSLVRGSLEAIASSELGILVHCAAGRDHTDMVTALLLANAGVFSDDVAANSDATLGALELGAETRRRLCELLTAQPPH